MEDEMSVEDELKKVMEELVIQEKKIASVRWTFVRGIFYGFGAFVGSVFLVALLLYALSAFADVPIVGHFFSRLRDLFDGAANK
jgi:hypothetical protein